MTDESQNGIKSEESELEDGLKQFPAVPECITTSDQSESVIESRTADCDTEDEDSFDSRFI